MVTPEEYTSLMVGVHRAVVTGTMQELNAIATSWYATRPETECEHVNLLGQLRGRLLDWSPANLECLHVVEVLHFRIPLDAMLASGPKQDSLLIDNITADNQNVEPDGTVLLASMFDMACEPGFNPRKVISRFVFEAVVEDLIEDQNLTRDGTMVHIASGSAWNNSHSKFSDDLSSAIAKARDELDKMFPTYQPEGGET
jgi:hypothetical protein